MVLPIPLTQKREQDKRDEDRGKGQLDVDDAHDEAVDASAETGGGEAHGEPDD